MSAVDVQEEVRQKAAAAKRASGILANLSTGIKNQVLEAMAVALDNSREYILSENKKDCDKAQQRNLSAALIDRLLLTNKRIDAMLQGIKDVISLPDPVGEVIEGWRRPNNLEIFKVRVPLGVIGIIYEARPNVTVDAAALCFKAGNSVILRGGSEAINSNIALVKILKAACGQLGIPEGAIEIIENTAREAAIALMQLNQYIDVLIPRGGAGLIKTVIEQAKVPVIETGVGNCHIYVDEFADLSMAEEIVYNAKVQRPSVCNAVETLLVHNRIAADFLPKVAKRLKEAQVELRGCERTIKYYPEVVPATEEDWYTEYLALILAVKVVDSLQEAIEHINKYGSKHTEAIITNNYEHARSFTKNVDASTVFVNVSTRFTDGGEFGLGAEIGISTQKLHARGPMGLKELTSYKYIVWGDGQIRT